MADVSKFNIDGTEITVKDGTARTDASNALTLAQQVAALSRLEVTYTSATETISFTRVQPTSNGGN